MRRGAASVRGAVELVAASTSLRVDVASTRRSPRRDRRRRRACWRPAPRCRSCAAAAAARGCGAGVEQPADAARPARSGRHRPTATIGALRLRAAAARWLRGRCVACVAGGLARPAALDLRQASAAAAASSLSFIVSSCCCCCCSFSSSATRDFSSLTSASRAARVSFVSCSCCRSMSPSPPASMPDRVPARWPLPAGRRHDFQPRAGGARGAAARGLVPACVAALRRARRSATRCRLRRRAPRRAPCAICSRTTRGGLGCAELREFVLAGGTRSTAPALQPVDVVADEGVRIGAQQREHRLVERCSPARRRAGRDLDSVWPARDRAVLRSARRAAPACRSCGDGGAGSAPAAGWRDRDRCRRGGGLGGRRLGGGAGSGCAPALRRPAARRGRTIAFGRRDRRRLDRRLQRARPRCAARRAAPSTRGPAGPAPSRLRSGRSAAAG